MPLSEPYQISRSVDAHRGLQVVSVISGSVADTPGERGTGSSTSVCDGLTISERLIVYVYQVSAVSMTTTSPARSLSRSRNGSPLVARCPATAKLPTAPGSTVVG